MDRQTKSRIMPGILLTATLAVIAFFVSSFVPFFGSVSIALLLGIAVGNGFKPGKKFSGGIRFSETTLLSCAIVLMGLKVNLNEIAQFGSIILYLIIPLIVVTIISALALGKLFGLQSTLSLLLGVGNAVCGTSAIAAVAPTTKATTEEAGISIGVVNLIGTIGMLVLPLVALQLHLSQQDSALLIGGALQAVGQVVAAGNFVSEPVGDLATLFKMSRVLMIVPLVIVIPLLMRQRSGEKMIRNRKLVPSYLIGFLISSVVVSLFGGDMIAIKVLLQLEKVFLIVAMAGIGLRIEFTHIMSTAPKALLVCMLITLIQISIISLYVMN